MSRSDHADHGVPDSLQQAPIYAYIPVSKDVRAEVEALRGKGVTFEEYDNPHSER